MTTETINQLKNLAVKYEVSSFLDGDPSRFMHRYNDSCNQEIAAFIAAQLAFGRRDAFLPKLEAIFNASADNASAKSPAPLTEWIMSGGYKSFFPKSSKKFYRFFSYKDMNDLCAALAQILKKYGSLGEAVKKAYFAIENSNGNRSELDLVSALISLFPDCGAVSQNPKGACKKLHMFLRWMVRRNSPVDLGLWDWVRPSELIMPLDVHVLDESKRLGLIPQNASPSAKTALFLTNQLKQIWPDDPCKGDFALFGLGVDTEAGSSNIN